MIDWPAKVHFVNPRLPWARIFLVVFFVAIAALVVTTFRDYGISWDEMLQNTYGEKLIAFYATGFQDLSAFDYSNLYLYGGLFDMVADLLNRVSPFGEYETRHLLGGLVRDPIAAVVSGLPLQTKPFKQRTKLIDEAFAMMLPGAPFIQFTYAMVTPIPKRPEIAAHAPELIWQNLPPARVWVYRSV